MKIYLRIRTWVMFGILVVLQLAISIIAKLVTDTDPNNWTMMVNESGILLVIVTIFTVVASADSVAGEFTSGTIKLLLIRPWSRSKILLSKYISLLLFALFMSAVVFVLTLVVNILFFGYDSSPNVVSNVLHVNRDLPIIGYLIMYFFYQFISLIITVTLAFMLSTVFRSGGLAIGLSLFVLLAGGTVSGMLSMLDYAWVKYILFLNMNLATYLNEAPIKEGMTMGFSVAVLAVYYVIFISVTWLIFNKRDVAA